MLEILIDTNVLLSGHFSPESFSRRILNKVKDGSIKGYILANTRSEARKVLKRVNRNTGTDLRGVLLDSLKYGNFIHLPRVSYSETDEFKKINGTEDKAICVSAKEHNLIVCTNDIEDFKAAGEYGVSVMTPYELIYYHGPLDIQYAINGGLASPEKGTFYIEVTSYWSGFCSEKSDKLCAIFDTDGIGGLYFSRKDCSFIFFIDDGPSATAKLNIIDEGDSKVCLVASYDCNKGVSVFVNYRGTRGVTRGSWTPNTSEKLSCRILNGRKGNFGASANFINFAAFPQSCTEKCANNLMGKKSLSHPLDNFSVENMTELYYGVDRGRIERAAYTRTDGAP